MRKAAIAFLSVLSVAGAARAQAPSTPWANKLFGVDLSHDFGTVARGTQLKYSFKFTNIYQVPLEITQVRATCGCVTAKANPTILQPNESGTLDVVMNTSVFSGQKNLVVYVTVGPQFVSTASLALSANARGDIVFNPGEIDFGQVGKGQSPQKAIEVEQAGNPNWAVTEIVKAANAPFDLKVERLPQKVGGFVTVGYRILATLKPTAAAGPFKQEVILKTNDPVSPVISFPVSGTVKSALTVAPNPVNLAGLKAGEGQNLKLVLTGARPFRVTAVEGGDDQFKITLPEAASAVHILDLRVQPRAAGPVNRQLILRTDLDNESITVNVEGAVVP